MARRGLDSAHRDTALAMIGRDGAWKRSGNIYFYQIPQVHWKTHRDENRRLCFLRRMLAPPYTAITVIIFWPARCPDIGRIVLDPEMQAQQANLHPASGA